MVESPVGRGFLNLLGVAMPNRYRKWLTGPRPTVAVDPHEDYREAAGTATPELLDEIAARHHMEVVGPVPDTYL